MLNWFLIGNLRAQGVPESLQIRLMDDNKLASQKFNQLFRSVTSDSWKEAIEKVSDRDGIDFAATSELMREASEIRNEFLHTGFGWRADAEFSKICINRVPTLVRLFCSIHNAYTHPIIFARIKS